jgi:hypothetical protein
MKNVKKHVIPMEVESLCGKVRTVNSDGERYISVSAKAKESKLPFEKDMLHVGQMMREGYPMRVAHKATEQLHASQSLIQTF